MPCKLCVNGGADGSVITDPAKSMVTTSAPRLLELDAKPRVHGEFPNPISFKSLALVWMNAFAGKDVFARCMSVFAKELPVLGT